MIKKLLDVKTDDCKQVEGIKFQQNSTKDIAIIGIALRLPKAKNMEEYWANIAGGADCVTAIPTERVKDIENFMAFKGIHVEKYFEKGYLSEIDKFDYSFFGMSPKEAALIDPNQRMFLETAWEAIEDSGYGADRLRGSRTGVFLGFGSELLYKRLIDEVEPASGAVALPGNMAPVIASRISYLLDLNGPSLAIDTACSSSLVALHYACQSIRCGECGMAIAGAVSLSLMPVDSGQRIGIESSDGRSRAFDDSADGTGNGEGVAALLLKPLHKAVDDKDHIYAVIKGSAVNQNGSSMGITTPNPAALEDVIVRAWKNAGINPETLSYIEAQGTGTKLGDPIEMDGIQRAFKRYTSKKAFCAIGSVESNIGHLDSASGIASLIKAVLMLTERKLPPTLHFKRPNRQIAFEDSPVYVNDRLVDWEAGDTPRMCGVSSFGISGTNCHMILEEAPVTGALDAARLKSLQGTHVLALSAKSEEALTVLLESYRKLFETAKHEEVADICYTANTGRGHYNCRVAFMIGEDEKLSEVIKPFDKIVSGASLSDRIFYGKHSIINDKRQERDDNEITREELGQLDTEANARLEHLLAGNGMETGLLQELLQFYVKGATVAWNRLYKSGKYRTVRVPVYPFERKRCWIDIPKIKQQNTINAAAQLSEQEGRELPEIILRGRKNGDGYTETEKKLGRIWGLVLGLAEINIYDDFFELGGHSLLAARLEAELEKRDMLVDGVDVYRYKNIKDMADFFEGNSDEKPDRQEDVSITIQSDITPEGEPHSENVGEKTVATSSGSMVLENIQPFNDVYYISCFYNSFFPVLTYFNKSIKPFLINDIIKYDYQWQDADTAVKYLPLQHFENVLEDDGIKAEYKLQSQNIIGDIKASIDGGNPVIIWVDCYYEALRIDTYQKRHLSHTWLIFGYDDENQCCHIVEHSRSDNLSYEKRVISYWDVVNSYHGYLNRFQKESNDPSFYTFCLSDAAKSTPSDGEYIEKYMENTASRSNEIAKELDGLEAFINEACAFLMNEASMQAKAEKIMNILTSIINAKQVERYIFAQLFGEESEITKLMGEITEYWNDARKPISRYVFSKIYKNKAMEKSAECFKKIYTLEYRMNIEYLCRQNKEER